jgi:predicted glycosyl hydrolase (DUF1957 family)
MSFNFGPTLHRWIEKEDPALDQTIRESGTKAVAQCYSHMIMPLASAEDKKTQTIWGIRDFEYRFKRSPKGMWLPETAVNTGRLEVLAKRHNLYILAPEPVRSCDRRRKRMETPTSKASKSPCLPLQASLRKDHNEIFNTKDARHRFRENSRERRQVQGRTVGQ